MNMLKNKICLLCVSVCFITTNAYADLNVNIKEVDGAVVVGGYVNNDRGHIPMAMTVSLGEKIIAAGQTYAERNLNDEIEFLFDKILFPINADTGTYTIDVSADYIGEHDSSTYEYTSMGDIYPILCNLVSNEAGNNSDEWVIYLNDNCAKLGISEADYNKLSNKSTLFQMMKTHSYNIPEQCDNANDLKLVKQALIDYRNNIKTAVALCSLMELSDEVEAKIWIDKYYDFLNIGNDNTNTSYDESEMIKYYNDAVTKSGFYKRLVGATNINNSYDAQRFILEQFFLENVFSFQYSRTKEIMEKYSSFFDIDWTLYKNVINVNNIGKFYSSLAGVSYSNMQKFCDAVLKELNSLKTGSGSDGANAGKSGGGGGGGNWDASNNFLAVVTEPKKTVENEKAPFTDITDVAWANEAITFLYNNKVINGKSSYSFAPHDYVTRAEFVKMIVQLLFEEPFESADIKFTDVDDSIWYNKYVQQAVIKNIVTGTQDKRFLPEENITREDIAVIISRAYGLQGVFSESVFSDMDKVSDYAKNAVCALKEHGIINGTGDNKFEPKRNATRAEAAKMIYAANCIK